MADKARVVWLSGNAHQRKLTLAEIKGQFLSVEPQIVDGNYSVPYLEQLFRQGDCFSSQRFFLIREMPTPTSSRTTMISQLKKLLEDVPEDCFVVFDGLGEEKAISSHIAKFGKVFDFPDKIDPNRAVDWLKGVFKEMGKEITAEDAQTLIDTSGHDNTVGGIGGDLLRMLALKICLYVGNRKRNITREDVMLNIFPSEEIIIWKMLDALDSKDLAACHNAFHKLIEKEQDVVGAVNILYNIALPRYKLLLFLKEGMARKGATRQSVAASAADMKKFSQEGVGWQMKMVPDIAESGVNEGKQKTIFNDYGINTALNGNFGKPPTIDLYSRKEIVRIVVNLQAGLSEMRARSQSDAAMSVLADVLFLAACTQLDDTVLAELRKPYGYTL